MHFPFYFSIILIGPSHGCVKCRKHYRTRNTASYMTEVPHSLVAANDQDITVFELNECISEARAAKMKPSIKVE